MNCQKIEEIMSALKVNKRGQIRGQGRVMDKLHSEHLKDIDKALMDIRIFVARLSTGYSCSDALKMIDEFIYKTQTKP